MPSNAATYNMIRAAANDPSDFRFSAPVDLQAAASEGKRATFSMVAYTGAAMNLSGFYTPVIVELSGLRASRAQIPILLDHDASQIVGQGSVTVDSSGARIIGTVTGDDAPSQKVITHAKNGFLWQASIGANITRREFVEPGKKAVVNGREVTGPIVIAREALLKETSFVAIGADEQTSAAVAASHSANKGHSMDPFIKWLEAKGIDPAKIDDATKAALNAAHDAEVNAKNAPNGKGGDGHDVNAGNGKNSPEYGTLDAIFEKNKLDRARRSEIARISANALRDNPGMGDEIEAAARKAIDDNLSPTDFELAILRAMRPQTGGRSGRRSSAVEVSDKVIEAAVCQAAKLKTVEDQYDEQTLEAADKHFRGGIGLQQLLLTAARENGCDSLNVRGGLEEVLRSAFPSRRDGRDIRASSGFSSISLPNILSNVANKFVTEAFMAVEDTWRKISAIRPVNDFKQITNHSLTGDLQYEAVGPSGEIKHGTLGEQVYTNQAKTYGKMLAITRTDIINDDLGAFAAVPKRLGRGGALAINNVFWTEFLSNSSFFTTGRGNYDEGTDTALDVAGLTKAMGTFWSALTDPDGKPLASTPRFLLVPPAQLIPAKVLNGSTALNPSGQTSSTAVVGNLNPFAGMFEVVSSVYLANSSYTGYSALAWYLLADPNDIPVIETCFLGGREMPTVETADADFDQLGVRMRAYHDFGCSKQEYRGGCKFKGES